MNLTPNDYRGKPIGPRDGQPFKPFDHRGCFCMEVLQDLVGHPWDEYSLSLVHALRPSLLRVVVEDCQIDSELWRVTVFLKRDRVTISHIHQEVEVGLPKGCNKSGDLIEALRSRRVEKRDQI